MDINDKRIIKNYLSNLHVNVYWLGYNTVSTDWRDIDYIPEHNKFYFICDGEGWLKIGENEYYPKPGQMFLMPAGLKQSYSYINSNVFTKYWCHFTAKIGEINLFDIIKLPYFIEVPQKEVLEGLFNDLLNSHDSLELSASLMLKSAMLRLISYYIDNSIIELVNIANPNNCGNLNIVLDYIEKNFHKNITVEELSSIAHLHPNYFIKVFKNHFGISPIRFINNRRIDEAKLLLTSTTLTVSEIYSRIGFNDIYYFSKLFKEFTGSSPVIYKQSTSHS